MLTWEESHRPAPEPVDAEHALRETFDYWSQWVSRCTYQGRWRDAVVRSLITLKALTHAPTGGIVAAPTTSLPEKLGGVRNWDYRFCWLRDATMTLQALMYAGYQDEARDWRRWLLRAVAGNPVRIGNQAVDQFQLDVYGEVMDALYQARTTGFGAGRSTWALQKTLMCVVADRWTECDEGIWEVRGGAQHFTHSKLMAWVAADRAGRSVERFGLDGPLEEWRQLRERHPGGHPRPRLRPRPPYLHPVLRLARARYCAADDPDRRVPARGRRAGLRHGRRHRAGAAGRRLRPALHPGRQQRPGRSAPLERGLFWPARSGSRTTTRCRDGTTRPSRCSSGCSRCATTWACAPRSTTSTSGGWWATSRRRSAMCR